MDVWIDMCRDICMSMCTSVHTPLHRQDYLHTTFANGVRAIGRTVLILRPWIAPVALKRSWCLWEIACTATEANLQVCHEMHLGANTECTWRPH